MNDVFFIFFNSLNVNVNYLFFQATPEMFYDVKTLQKLLPSCILH